MVRIKFLEQNIGNKYFLDHLVGQNINHFYSCIIWPSPQIKVFFFQILNLQTVIC